MAQVEDNDLPEEEKPSSEETVLMNKNVSFGHNVLREWADVNKGNDLGNSVKADKHCRDIR